MLRAHLRVNSLDILPLGQGALVTSKTPLGKFVNSLVGGTSAGFDHIEDSPLVGGESGDLTGNFAAECGALAESLK